MRIKWWAPKYEEPLDCTGAATAYPEQAGAYPLWNAPTRPFPVDRPLMTPLAEWRSRGAVLHNRGIF
jgi:hypothetical protein